MKKNVRNVISLFALHFGNSIFPLMVYPVFYLRVDAESFNNFIVAEAIALLVLTLCLFGIDPLGIVKISEAQDSQKKKSEIYLAVLALRLLLMTFSISLTFITLFYLSPKLSTPFLIWSLLIFGTVLQSNFYFLAIEKNEAIAFASVASRLLFASLSIYLVGPDTSENELAAFVATSSFASGICNIVYAMRTGITFCKVNPKKLVSLAKESSSLFASSVAVFLYRGSNVLILGAAGVGPAEAAVYALTERLIKNMQSMVFPLTQFYASKFSKCSKTMENIWSDLWRATRIQLLILTGSTILFIMYLSLANHNLLLQLGFSSDMAVVMMPAIAFGAVNYICGTIAFAKFGLSTELLLIIVLIGLLHILLTFAFVAKMGVIGASITYVMSEALLLVLSLVFLLKASKRKK